MQLDRHSCRELELDVELTVSSASLRPILPETSATFLIIDHF